MDDFNRDQTQAIADALAGDHNAPPDEQKNVPMTDSEKHMQLLDEFNALSQKYVALKSEVAQRRILDELTTVARKLKIPESIVIHDLPKYAPDFMIDGDKVALRADTKQDVTTVLKTLQKERPHWAPTSVGVGFESHQHTFSDDNRGLPSNNEWFTTSPIR